MIRAGLLCLWLHSDQWIRELSERSARIKPQDFRFPILNDHKPPGELHPPAHSSSVSAYSSPERLAMSFTNYSHLYLAEDTGHILIAVSVLFIILDTIFLTLRFYAGILHKTSVGVDDFVISVAWCTHIGLCILGISTSIPPLSPRSMILITY
jgi:hypothetical protein